MSEQRVPGMPSLTSIQDPEVRKALKVIIDHMNVRSGFVGDGDQKFLTVRDLKDIASGKSVTIRGGQTVTINQSPNSPLGSIGSAVDSAVSSVKESKLYRHLRDRIDRIDMPSWFAGKFGAAIQTEQTLREQQNYAMAQQVTTAVTNINGNIALVQDQITATSDLAGATASAVTQLQTEVGGVQGIAQTALQLSQDINGKLDGTWSVKFQLGSDGKPKYITGVGLNVTNETGAPQSKFAVAADAFSIGGPGIYINGVLQDSFIPFVVRTSDWSSGGKTYSKGVYMPSVYITQAQIQNLKVTTAEIEDAAITSAKFSGTIQSDNYVPGTSGWKIVKTGTSEFNDDVTINGTLTNSTLQAALLGNVVTGSQPLYGSGEFTVYHNRGRNVIVTVSLDAYWIGFGGRYTIVQGLNSFTVQYIGGDAAGDAAVVISYAYL